MECPLCRSSRVKTSQLHWSDFPKLLIGRVPVAIAGIAYGGFVFGCRVIIFKLI